RWRRNLAPCSSTSPVANRGREVSGRFDAFSWPEILSASPVGRDRTADRASPPVAVCQPPKLGRFCSRFNCLSARFCFRDLDGFLALSFFGDLSPIETSLLLVCRIVSHHERCSLDVSLSARSADRLVRTA